MYERWSLASVHDSARLGVVSPAGIGFTIASWIAYMTMNGVLNASVSAGSSQREARVTCRPQRISPAGGLAACARADTGWPSHAARSQRPSRMPENRERECAREGSMAPTVVRAAGKVNR